MTLVLEALHRPARNELFQHTRDDKAVWTIADNAEKGFFALLPDSPDCIDGHNLLSTGLTWRRFVCWSAISEPWAHHVNGAMDHTAHTHAPESPDRKECL